MENYNIELNNKLNDETIQTDFQKLYEIQSQIEDNSKLIDNLMKEWEGYNS